MQKCGVFFFNASIVQSRHHLPQLTVVFPPLVTFLHMCELNPRFIHLRRILRLAALTGPPSCGDDPHSILTFLYFTFCSCFNCNKWPLEAARPANILEARSSARANLAPAAHKLLKLQSKHFVHHRCSRLRLFARDQVPAIRHDRQFRQSPDA